MINVKVGDTVTRVIAGIEQPLVVTEVNEEFIFCGPWCFERANGVEHDPYLHWGSKWGMSGSYLKEGQ